MEELETKLLKENWIDSSQFVAAKAEQKKLKKSLYSVLIKLGFLTEEDVYMFFAQNTNIPFVNIFDYKIDDKLLGLFPEESYRENLFFPLFKTDNSLYICMANPLDAALMNTLEVQVDCDIVPLFGCPSVILKAINTAFGPDDKYFDLEALIVNPQKLEMMPLTRESERLILRIPVDFKISDDKIELISSAYISAVTCDISDSGKSVGIKSLVYLPPSTHINIKFPSQDACYEALAEVTRCHLQRGKQYFLGVKFLEIAPDLLKNILAQARTS